MAQLNLSNLSKPKPMAPGPATTPGAATTPTMGTPKKKKVPAGGGLAAALAQKSLV